jgi:hypothetical protein
MAILLALFYIKLEGENADAKDTYILDNLLPTLFSHAVDILSLLK